MAGATQAAARLPAHRVRVARDRKRRHADRCRLTSPSFARLCHLLGCLFIWPILRQINRRDRPKGSILPHVGLRAHVATITCIEIRLSLLLQQVCSKTSSVSCSVGSPDARHHRLEQPIRRRHPFRLPAIHSQGRTIKYQYGHFVIAIIEAKRRWGSINPAEIFDCVDGRGKRCSPTRVLHLGKSLASIRRSPGVK